MADRTHYFIAKPVGSWTIANFTGDNLDQRHIDKLVETLPKVCNQRGMQMGPARPVSCY